MISVAAYCRVSTDKEDQANSFQSQQRYFRSYICRQPDWELYQVYADEGVTGTSTRRRAAFHQMLRDARLGRFRLILTKEVSRFSRNILDTIAYTRELRTLGVGVVFLNDGINTLDPDAELRLSIMGSLAQEESRRTSSRVKWGQTRRMEQGVVFGRSLLGYDVKGGVLTINPKGAEIVRQIFQKYGVEKKGAAVIARELREAGYCTQRGNVMWSGGQILKILKNEKYVGDLVQKKTITPDYLTHDKKYNHGEEKLVILRDHHEPIIDRALWDMVQAEREKRNRNGERGAGHSSRHMFSGKIRCGVCGASFVSRKKVRKDGSAVRRWSCYTAVSQGAARLDPQGNAVGCSVGWSLGDETAVALLCQVLRALALDREALARGAAAAALAAVREEGEDIEELEQAMNRLQSKREAALDAFFAQEVTREEMRRMTDRYDRELEELQARRTAEERQRDRASAPEALEADFHAQAAAVLRGERASRVFSQTILDCMVVHPDRRVEVRLNWLPQTWTFAVGRSAPSEAEDRGKQRAPSPRLCGDEPAGGK